MKHNLPPLDTLKVFEASARHLSFSVAANELCMSKSAVSYQIKKLEEHLACCLFKRSVRQIYLTDAGQTLFQSTQAAFAELSEGIRRVGSSPVDRCVVVAATTYVAVRCLSPVISGFCEAFPDISISFVHQVNEADFRLSDVDMALRWGPCAGQLDQQQPTEYPMPLVVAVSPVLLKRIGIESDQTLDRLSLLNGPLSKVTLLCEDRPTDLWQEWFANDDLLINPRRVINDANVRVQAAIDGQGLILADQLMSAEMANGLLVVPFKEELVGYGYRLLRSGTALNTDAQALYDWLFDRLPSTSATMV